MMIVYTSINENINNEVFGKILHLVSEQKQRKVVGCHKAVDRKLNLHTEVIVRLMACMTLGIGNNEIISERESSENPLLRALRACQGFLINDMQDRHLECSLPCSAA